MQTRKQSKKLLATEKSKADHLMLQSHKHLSLDQKRNLTPTPSIGVQIRFFSSYSYFKGKAILYRVYLSQWPKHAEEFATFQSTRTCSYKSFHTVFPTTPFFQKSPLVERQRLTAWLCWFYFWQQQ